MTNAHEALDEAMNSRRLALRLSWRAVSQEAGISYESLRAIRQGKYRPTELTARGLDDTLRWTPGSTLAILGGGEPTPIESIHGPSGSPASPPGSLSEELDLAARLLGATVKEMRLSPEEADAVWNQVRASIVADHDRSTERQEPPTGPHQRRTGS